MSNTIFSPMTNEELTTKVKELEDEISLLKSNQKIQETKLQQHITYVTDSIKLITCAVKFIKETIFK